MMLSNEMIEDGRHSADWKYLAKDLQLEDSKSPGGYHKVL